MVPFSVILSNGNLLLNAKSTKRPEDATLATTFYPERASSPVRPDLVFGTHRRALRQREWDCFAALARVRRTCEMRPCINERHGCSLGKLWLAKRRRRFDCTRLH
jgi:hypothetical protein